MSFLKSVYNKSPIFIQHLMTSISGYQKNRTRYGKSYFEYRSFLRDFDDLPIKEKLSYQENELIKFINYAKDNSKFYQQLYKKIDIETVQNINDIKRLPIVEKELLRENIHDVFTVSSKSAVEAHTGGTTGKSLVVLMTPEDMMKRMATLDHFKFRVGYDHLKMSRATFNGQHIVPPNQKKKVFWRYNAACKQMIYSSFHLTESNMKYYVDSLIRFKPKAIDGFFMSMCDIAGYIERHNIDLGFKPIAIFPTSETLTDSGRELLERVFRCKVYDQYASSEGAPFVTECKEQVLHVELASGIFEYFDDDNDEVLVTSFTTHGTPLIRYRIGDSMAFSGDKAKCACGVEGLLVKQIEGRQMDFLFSSDGGKISSVNIANSFKNIPNAIVRAQVIQHEFNEITVLLEIDENRYKDEFDNLLYDEFKGKFGANTSVNILHVDEIPREPSGKYRLVKNNVVN